MIYYNALILSNLLETKKKQVNEADVARLSRISLIAWQHINLHGRYEFSKTPQEIDIKAIVDRLSQLPLDQLLTG